MRRISIVLSVAAVLAATATFAKTTTHKASHKTMETKGTLQSYDVATHKITLKTATGEETFTLASNAKVYEGTGKAAKNIAMATLGSETGDHAVVKFSEENGEKTATSVHLTEKGETAKKTSTAAKTEPTTKKKY